MQFIKEHKTMIVDIVRIAFGVLFMFSGVMKLYDLGTFEIALGKFKMLNETTIIIAKYGFPFIEILFGVLLAFKIQPALISQLILWLLTLFTAVIVTKYIEGEEISCNCFGNFSSSKIDIGTIIRNVFLIGIGILLIVNYSQKEENNNSFTTPNEQKKILDKAWLNVVKQNLIILLFLFAAVQIVVLSMQNRGLKDNISLLLMDKDILQPGELVKEFSARKADSSIVNVSYTFSGKTILFLMSTKCEPCKINLNNWIKLCSDLRKKDSIRIIAVAINTLKEVRNYVLINKLNFIVLATEEINFKVNYKAFTTPQTVIVNDKGVIIRSYPGILNPISIQKIYSDLSNI